MSKKTNNANLEGKQQNKGGLFLIGFFLLMFLSGCTSSFDDCVSYCKISNKEDFRYNKTCTNFNQQEYICERIDYSARQNFCYEECRVMNIQIMGGN